MGFHRAGWDVYGADLKRQPRYPFPFFEVDVLEIPDWFLAGFDAIAASPPCQFGTVMRHAPGAKGERGHLNLIPPIRTMLIRSGKPYIIENVVGVRDHLINPVSLFGQMFDLHMVTSTGQRFDLDRERLFETNWGLTPPRYPGRPNPVANVFGGHLRNRSAAHGGRGTVCFPGEDRPALARQLFQMPWASMAGISESVPPAYAEHIGRQLLAKLNLSLDGRRDVD